MRRPSPPKAVELATRLREAGAKMYGAFWCSHCQEQKQAFGAEAQRDLPYVECFPQGFRSVRCKASLKAFLSAASHCKVICICECYAGGANGRAVQSSQAGGLPALGDQWAAV